MEIFDNSTCFNDGITITFTEGYPSTRHDLYKDSVLVLSNIFSPCFYSAEDSEEHSYKIRAINYVGTECYAADSETVSFSDQAIAEKPLIYGGNANICPSETVLLTTQPGKTNYKWYKDGLEISGANTNQLLVTESGYYSVSFTDGNGCSSTSDAHLVYSVVPCVINIAYQTKGTFSELAGNSNSFFEKGEKFSIPVTITNAGNSPATNVTAFLTGNGITVCNNPGSFGNIPAGETSTYTFEFVIDSNFSPCGGEISFNLVNKSCEEKNPAGSDETNLFSIQVGNISYGVPTEVVLSSTGDSWINQEFIDTNYGGYTCFYVQSKSLQARRTLIKFDISSIPSGSTINSATLELYATAGAGNPQIDLHRISADWSENAVTWNNQPSFDSTIVSSLTSSGTGWKSWNVKSLIEDYLNGTYTNYGFLLKCNIETATSTLNKVFNSRENATASYRPLLRINYTPPPTVNCDYVGSGECSVILGEVAPGDTYENAQIWSEDKTTQSWPYLAGATGYKLYRIVYSDLPKLMTTEIDSCVRYQGVSNSVDLSSDDPSSDIDKIYYYIVTATNGTSEGTAGNSTQEQRILNSSGNCQ